MSQAQEPKKFEEKSTQQIEDVTYHVKSHFKDTGDCLYMLIKASIKNKIKP